MRKVGAVRKGTGGRLCILIVSVRAVLVCVGSHVRLFQRVYVSLESFLAILRGLLPCAPLSLLHVVRIKILGIQNYVLKSTTFRVDDKWLVVFTTHDKMTV